MEQDRASTCLLTLQAESLAELRQQAARAPASKDRPTGDGSLRLLARAATPEELTGVLQAFAAGDRSAAMQMEQVRPDTRVAFVCAGQSETRVGMGAELYDASPVFKATMDQCSAVVEESHGVSLTEVLYASGDPSLLDDARVAQPALFALQAALVELWKDWGVMPAAVTGHSLGEYAAAYAAGVMSIEGGIRLVARRGQLTQERAASGQMAVVFCDEETVRTAAAQEARAVAVAAVNAPDVVVVSGPEADIRAFVAAIKARDISAKPLKISHAFHSPCIDPMLPGLEQAAAEIALGTANIPFVSMLEGRLLGADEAASPSYWRRHAREPVRFLDAVRELGRSRCDVFLELGPHRTLTALGERCVPAESARWMSSLKRTGDDLAVLGDAACALWLAGVDVDPAAIAKAVGWRYLNYETSG